VTWNETAVVGRIVRPHGIRGQVVVNLETDFPHERFQTGAEFFAKAAAAAGNTLQSVPGPAEGRPIEESDVTRLVIATVRFHNERPIVGFEGVDDMDQASALAGIELRVPIDRLTALPPSTFYRHDLVGCAVERLDGSRIGQVTDVEGTLGRSRLVVSTERGEVLVPLVEAICRSIDPAGKRIVIEPPDGLLELNQK
jgi:16S rRNA processing protein RimM